MATIHRAPHLSKKRPVPRGQVPQILPNLLLSTLLAPFVGQELTVPQIPWFQPPDQLSSPLALITQDASTHRAPLIVPHHPLPTQQPDSGIRSIALLAPVAAAPFFQTEWPVPPPTKVQPPFQVGNSYALIGGAGEKPFLQSEWPNPEPLPTQEPIQHETFIPLFDREPVVTRHDWPNPLIAPTVHSDQVAMPLAILVDAGEKAFVQTEWPNPGPIVIQQPQDLQLPLPLVVAPPPPKPFLQSDWPSPEPITIQQPQDVQLSLGLSAEVPKPFAQIDWPNPQIDPNALAAQILITVRYDISVPFSNLDWPNPIVKPTVHSDQQQMPLGILAEVGDKPFAQLDWINPDPLPTQTPFQVGSLLALPGEKPFEQSDWQNPQVEERQQPLQLSSSLALIGAVEAPFAQFDWPNPTVSISIQQHQQIGSSYALIGDAGEKPFAQLDWITPPGLLPQEPVQGAKPVALVEADVLPFAQFDWPLPTVSVLIQQPDILGSALVLIEVPIVATPFVGRHIAEFFN